MSCSCGKPKNHCDPCAGHAMSPHLVDPNRGTGRTLHMVQALTPDVRLIAVHSREMKLYLERMLRDVRPDLFYPKDMNTIAPRVIVVRSTWDIDRVRGCTFEIDHALLELAHPEVRDLLQELYRVQPKPHWRAYRRALDTGTSAEGIEQARQAAWKAEESKP